MFSIYKPKHAEGGLEFKMEVDEIANDLNIYARAKGSEDRWALLFFVSSNTGNLHRAYLEENIPGINTVEEGKLLKIRLAC